LEHQFKVPVTRNRETGTKASQCKSRRISQNIGNVWATQTLKTLALQYHAQVEALEQCEAMIAEVSVSRQVR
jgi:hypothetical protein